MKLAQEHRYGDGIAVIHGEWGELMRDQRKWQEAKMHFEKAIEWCEQYDEADLDISR